MPHSVLWIIGSLIVLAILFWSYALLTSQAVDENDEPIPGPGLQPVDFSGSTAQVAKNQLPHREPPSFVDTGTEGAVITCWKLSFSDRLKILVTGELWCNTWTFHQPPQTLYLSVNRADVFRRLRRRTRN